MLAHPVGFLSIAVAFGIFVGCTSASAGRGSRTAEGSGVHCEEAVAAVLAPFNNAEDRGQAALKMARQCAREKKWAVAETYFGEVASHYAQIPDLSTEGETLTLGQRAQEELEQVQCKSKRTEFEVTPEAEDLCSNIVVALRKKDASRLAEQMSCSMSVLMSGQAATPRASSPVRVSKALLAVLLGTDWIPDCTGQGVDVRFKGQKATRLGLEFGYLKRKSDGKKGWAWEKVTLPSTMASRFNEALRGP